VICHNIFLIFIKNKKYYILNNSKKVERKTGWIIYQTTVENLAKKSEIKITFVEANLPKNHFLLY